MKSLGLVAAGVCIRCVAWCGDATLADYPRRAGETDDTARLQRAIDANGGGVLHLPRGDYAVSSTLTISNGCALSLHKNARVYATQPMDYVLRVRNLNAWDTLDLRDFIEGGVIDAKGLGGCLSLDGFSAYRLENVKLFNAKTYALHTAADGSELVAHGLYVLTRMHGLAGNTGLFIESGRCHFDDVFVLDCTVGVHSTGDANVLTRIHCWGGSLPVEHEGDLPEMLADSVNFIIEGRETTLRDCYADTGQTGFEIRDAWTVRLQGCTYYNNPAYGLNDITIVRQTGDTGALLVEDCLFTRSSADERIAVYEGNGAVRWDDILYAGDWTGVSRPAMPARSGTGEAGLVARFTFDEAARFGYDWVRDAEIGVVSNTAIYGVAAASPTSCEAPRQRGLQTAGGWWQNNFMTVPGSAFGAARGIPCGGAAVTYALWVRPATAWQSSNSLGLGYACKLLRHGADGAEWSKARDHLALWIVRDGANFPQVVFSGGRIDEASQSAVHALGQPFDGGWHFIAATYADRVLTLYYDGVPVAAQTLEGACNVPDGSPLFLGAAAANYDRYVADRYAGAVDDLRVYDRALSADEVAAAYRTVAEAYDTDVLTWTGATGGGAVREPNNWTTESVRRTAAEIVASNAFLDVTALGDFGVVTHDTADTLTLQGVLCTNGQREVTLDVAAGTLALKRPVALRGLAAQFSFDDADDMLRDSGPAGLTATGGFWSVDAAMQPVPFQSVDGVCGKALDFPGNGNWWYWPSPYVKTDAAATTAANGIPCGTNAVCYSLWIKPCAANRWDNAMYGLADSLVWIFRRGDWGTARSTYLWLGKGSGGGRLYWSIANYVDAEDTCTYESPDLFDGSWHHVVCAYADRNLTLYYDGRRVAAKATAHALAMPDARSVSLGNSAVGGDRNENYKRYLGGFDEFKILSAAPTDEEVLCEYEQRSRPVREAPALPSPSPVTLRLEEGTTAEVRGPGHVYGALTGAGAVSVRAGASLSLDGRYALEGALSGEGAVASAGLAFGGEATAFTGTFTLREQARLVPFGTNGVPRAMTFGGTVALPSAATVVCGRIPPTGTATLTAATLTFPNGRDFSSWRTETGRRVRASLDGNTLKIRIPGACAIIIR